MTLEKAQFDFFVGLIGVPLCVLMDPIVMRDHLFLEPGGILGAYGFWFYCGMAIGWVSLFRVMPLQQTSPVLCGMLYGSAGFAFLLAIPLLPFALIGLLFVIGILGLFPIFVGMICIRHGRHLQAQRVEKNQPPYSSKLVGGVAASTFAFPIAVQGGINAAADVAMADVISGPQEVSDRAAARLHWLAPWTKCDQLVVAWSSLPSGSPDALRIAEVHAAVEGTHPFEILSVWED